MRTNVWIRKHNEDRWRRLEDKSAWVNKMLEGKGIDKLTDDSRIPADGFGAKEPCPGHDIKWDCGRPGCKYGKGAGE